jgi:hypothetical protein
MNLFCHINMFRQQKQAESPAATKKQPGSQPGSAGKNAKNVNK